MGQANCEGAKSVWLPASRGGLKAEAGWVDQRHDGHGRAAVGQIDAASASVVLDKYTQEVLVRDTLSVASRLHTSHHELIFWRDSLLDTLLLLGINNFVANFAKVNSHRVLPVSHASARSLNCLVH